MSLTIRRDKSNVAIIIHMLFCYGSWTEDQFHMQVMPSCQNLTSRRTNHLNSNSFYTWLPMLTWTASLIARNLMTKSHISNNCMFYLLGILFLPTMVSFQLSLAAFSYATFTQPRSPSWRFAWISTLCCAQVLNGGVRLQEYQMVSRKQSNRVHPLLN